MAKVEFLNCDTSIDLVLKRQEELESNGFVLVAQCEYTMIYQSTNESDRDEVLARHNEYMNLLKILGVDEEKSRYLITKTNEEKRQMNSGDVLCTIRLLLSQYNSADGVSIRTSNGEAILNVVLKNNSIVLVINKD